MLEQYHTIWLSDLNDDEFESNMDSDYAFITVGEITDEDVMSACESWGLSYDDSILVLRD